MTLPSENTDSINQPSQQFIFQQRNIDHYCKMEADSATWQYIQSHNKQLRDCTKEVQVQIVSPVVAITWMYMCSRWRNLLDFNFQRPSAWNKDTPVLRFNDTTYVSKHQIWDWHSFAMLKDEVLIHNGLIVQHGNDELFFILDIEYYIPNKFMNAHDKVIFRSSKTTNDWKPDVVCKYRRIVDNGNFLTMSAREELIIIDADSDFTVINPSNLTKPLFDHDGELFVIKNKTQHSAVATNSPFFFFVLGFDKYHHTTFTGKHDWDTHGVYWWIGNMNPEWQFSRKLTMIMGQIPDSINTNTIGQIAYSHWHEIMQDGISLWNGYSFEKVYGMISHQIADMEDRNHLQRRRKRGRHTRSDGALWLGYLDGCKWPDDCKNLLQVGIITPGPYLLKIWKLLYQDLKGQDNFWQEFDNRYTKPISLMTCDEDLYNEIPIASSLKSTSEINHTALMGCAKDALLIEWTSLHSKGNLDEYHTRTCMKIYLNEYFDGYNGCSSYLSNFKNKITVFKSFQVIWQKMIEMLICLPTIIDWMGNIDIIVALVRITGALYNCCTENSLENLRDVIKPVLAASYVYSDICVSETCLLTQLPKYFSFVIVFYS